MYMIKRCQLQFQTIHCRSLTPEISDRSLSSRQPSRRSELFKSPITFLVQFSQAVTIPGLQNYPFVWVQLTYRQWVLSLWVGYALSLQLVILELKSSKPEAFGLEKEKFQNNECKVIGYRIFLFFLDVVRINLLSIPHD